MSPARPPGVPSAPEDERLSRGRASPSRLLWGPLLAGEVRVGAARLDARSRAPLPAPFRPARSRAGAARRRSPVAMLLVSPPPTFRLPHPQSVRDACAHARVGSGRGRFGRRLTRRSLAPRELALARGELAAGRVDLPAAREPHGRGHAPLGQGRP